MTRARFALPWPPDADPPAAVQLDLWEPDCPRCGGAGRIRIAADEGDPTSAAPCPACGGTGLAAEEPRDFDWRE